MANFAVFTPGPTYTDTGDLSAAGKWISGDDDAFKVYGYNYEFERISAPGVIGQGSNAFSYRSLRLEFHVVYVDTSESGVLGTWNTDVSAMGAAIGTSVVVGGVTYYAYQLDPGASYCGRVRPVGLATVTYYARAVVVVDSLRLT